MRKVFPECKNVTLEEVYADLHFEATSTRPYVAINMVSSVDGRTTVGGNWHQNRIGSQTDRRLMGWVRQAVDLILRGAQTVRANPAYPSVSDDLVALRQSKGMTDQPQAAIVTNSCDLPTDLPIFTAGEKRPILLTSEAAPGDRLDALRSVADVIVAGEDNVDPERALQVLREEYDVDCLLLEGGPTLNYHFLRRGLVDELFWTVAPKMIGGKSELSLVEGQDLFDPLVQLKLVSAYTFEDELFLRYQVL